jgi:hypothetical protein
MSPGPTFAQAFGNMSKTKITTTSLLAFAGLAALVSFSARDSVIPNLGFDAFRKSEVRTQQSEITKNIQAPAQDQASDWVDEVQANYREFCGDIAQVDADLKDTQELLATLSEAIGLSLRRQEKISQESFDRLAHAERQESRLSIIQTLCAADHLRAQLKKHEDQTNKKETSNGHES